MKKVTLNTMNPAPLKGATKLELAKQANELLRNAGFVKEARFERDFKAGIRK